jgi:hypothetical protein
MIRSFRLLSIGAAVLIAACGGGAPGGDAEADGSAPRISLSEEEVGGARAGQEFRVTGSRSYDANRVRVSVAGLTDDGTVTDASPLYYAISFIEGASGAPRGTVILYLSPSLQGGTFPLVDSLVFLDGADGPPGATYIHRENDENSFFTVTEPGELSITRAGDTLSGTYRFRARQTDNGAFEVNIRGEFRDIELRSTIRN